MLPLGGSIGGRLTGDLTLGCLQGGVQVTRLGSRQMAWSLSTRRTTTLPIKVNLPHAINFRVQIWSRNAPESEVWEQTDCVDHAVEDAEELRDQKGVQLLVRHLPKVAGFVPHENNVNFRIARVQLLRGCKTAPVSSVLFAT